MSTTLKIKNTFEVEMFGRTYEGNQGAAGDEADTDFEITLTGNGHIVPGTVSNNSNQLAWEASNDNPTTLEYLWFWSDADVWLQLITAGGSVTIAIRAKTPQILGKGTMLPNASTTVLDGSGAPAVVDVTKVNVVNRSGGAANYVLAVMK